MATSLHHLSLPPRTASSHSWSIPFLNAPVFVVWRSPYGFIQDIPGTGSPVCDSILKEGIVQGIKLEDGGSFYQKIPTAGIPVLGHIGLTPQRQNALSGFRAQGKTTASALKVLDDALAVQEAGCFAIMLEAVPAEVASLIT